VGWILKRWTVRALATVMLFSIESSVELICGMERNSFVGIAVGLQLDLGNMLRLMAEARDVSPAKHPGRFRGPPSRHQALFLLQNIQAGSEAHPAATRRCFFCETSSVRFRGPPSRHQALFLLRNIQCQVQRPTQPPPGGVSAEILQPVPKFNQADHSVGGTRGRSWLRHCATSRKVVGSIFH